MLIFKNNGMLLLRRVRVEDVIIVSSDAELSSVN